MWQGVGQLGLGISEGVMGGDYSRSCDGKDGFPMSLYQNQIGLYKSNTAFLFFLY